MGAQQLHTHSLFQFLCQGPSLLARFPCPQAQVQGVREVVRGLRDLERAPEGAPPAPDILILQVRGAAGRAGGWGGQRALG